MGEQDLGTGSFRALRVRNYRIYASANLVSLTGTWMQRIGQDWLVLQLSGDSGIALGLITALQFGPSLLLSMYGGVLADRYDKRRLLMVTQALMGVLALVLGILVATGGIALWHVFVLAGGLGAVVRDRRPGPAGVRLGDGRPGAARQRRQPQLHDLQRGAPGGPVARRAADRRGRRQHRAGLLRQRGQLRVHDRRPGAHAGRRAAAEPARRPGGGTAAGGAGLHLGAPRSRAGDDPGVRHRHVRLQLPGDHRADGPGAVPPRRRGVRPAVHVLRRRVAERCAAVHPAQRPPAAALPRRSPPSCSACSRSWPG